MSKLSNKVAIVTGASKGIGAAIARHLAEAGAAVVVNYASSKEGADRVVADITRQGGRAVAVQANVASGEEIDRMFDLNVLGVLLASKAAAAHFDAAGGSIINISSVASTLTPASSSVYSASKAAVDAVTRVLAKELGPRNIRVNAINPGMVETEGVHAAGLDAGDFRKQLEAQTPLGRIGQPQDVAPAVVFLASAEAGWITGETLAISGGAR